MMRLHALVIASMLAGTAAPALATPSTDPPPTAARLYSQGEAEFRAGNIDAAIELFSRGYALEPKPEFLLNLAQCYRAQGRRTQAIEYFERFIKAAPDHPLRASAEKTLEDLRRAEALDRAIAQPSKLAPVPPPHRAPPPPPPHATGSSHTWMWLTAGAVVLFGGTAAIYVATRSSSSVDDTIRLPPP